MKIDYVPYKEALVLKKLGFNEPCLGYYYKENNQKELARGCYINSHNEYGAQLCMAPLYQQAFKYIRTNYNLACYVFMINGENSVKWNYRFWYFQSEKETPEMNLSRIDFKTYEEAEEACLKKLIRIISNG